MINADVIPPGINNKKLWLIQIIQLQMLGITICKFGADQIGFALLQNNLTKGIEVSALFKTRAVPLAIIFSISILYFTNVFTTLCLLVSILFEVYNIITIVEKNALKQFKVVSIQLLLGYPLMLVLVLIVSYYMPLSNNFIIAFLPIVSIIKFIYSRINRNKYEEYIKSVTDINVPIQQVENFLLFKMDQVLLATILVKLSFFKSNYNIHDFVYLTKYPEIVTGVLTGIWALYINDFSFDFTNNIFLFLKKHFGFLVILIAGIIIVGAIHFYLGKFTVSNVLFLYVLCFTNCILILPVNLINFQLMKLKKLKIINLLSLYSLLVGIFIIIISFSFNFGWGLFLIVPCQLISFLIFFKLNKKKCLA